MPRIKDINVFPYSGWPGIPWGKGIHDQGPFDDDVLDADAAARSARRVTETLTTHLRSAGFESRRASYRIMLNSRDRGDSVQVYPNIRFARDGFLGRIHISAGFRLLEPDQRAGVLLAAVEANLAPLAGLEGWSEALSDAVAQVRSDRYVCAWASDWKRTRDRVLAARIAVSIEDDGYGRWVLEIADESGDVVRTTTPQFGWTWLSNYERMAKGMRFTEPHVLTIGRGSMFLDTESSIDLDTGEVTETGESVDVGASVLSYPGQPGQSTPAMEVALVDA